MLFLLFVGLCFGSSNAETTTIPSTTEYDSFYPTTNWSDPIDWKLLKVFSNLQPGKNLLISPLSLKLVLVLLYEGSSGTTQRELQSVMQFPSKKEIRQEYKKLLNELQSGNEDVPFKLATRIFLDEEIEPQDSFIFKAREYYKADLESVNFSAPINASESVNSWVDEATNGKITQLTFPDDLNDAIMIVANAMYFKGKWRYKFSKDQTHLGKFHLSSSESILVPYMTVTDEFYLFESDSLEAKILRLPYQGGKYSMFIVLPMASGGLKDLIKVVSLRELHRHMYFLDKAIVSVTIPKFRFDFQARYAKQLKDFGLQEMFQNTASFTAMAKGNNTLLRMLMVTDIIQKSGISVDEQGSEIYAATDVTFGNKIGEVKDTFNATHPFFFFVQEEYTGAIIFLGTVENPADIDAAELPKKPTADELFADDSN